MLFSILFPLILISGPCTAIPQIFKQSKAKPDETFLLLESMRVKLAGLILTPSDRKDDILTDYNPDTNATGPGTLYIHSTCPWKFVERFNGNRIPNTTIEAVCVTSNRCSISGRTHVKAGNRKPLKEMPTSACQPINYFRWVRVLRAKSKKKRYVARLMPITVGCTCAYTSIKQAPGPKKRT